MKTWPRYPVIYEINTWVWLQELSQKYKSRVPLAKVPREEWDFIAGLKVDAVWFMGVWERSPAGIAIANQNKGLLEDFRRALSRCHAEHPFVFHKCRVSRRKRIECRGKRTVRPDSRYLMKLLWQGDDILHRPDGYLL